MEKYGTEHTSSLESTQMTNHTISPLFNSLIDRIPFAKIINSTKHPIYDYITYNVKSPESSFKITPIIFDKYSTTVSSVQLPAGDLHEIALTSVVSQLTLQTEKIILDKICERAALIQTNESQLLYQIMKHKQYVTFVVVDEETWHLVKSRFNTTTIIDDYLGMKRFKTEYDFDVLVTCWPLCDKFEGPKVLMVESLKDGEGTGAIVGYAGLSTMEDVRSYSKTLYTKIDVQIIDELKYKLIVTDQSREIYS